MEAPDFRGRRASQAAWSAVAYHIMFFTRINPAAWLFAAIFLLQAAQLRWRCSSCRHRGRPPRTRFLLCTAQ
jgi:hypothetical protein